MFADRDAAGQRLAKAFDAAGVSPDIVLAIPRGGLPVARPVADRLGVPLDVVVARKLGAPWNPELAIGAVASDGTAWLNETIVADQGIDDSYIEDGIETEQAAAAKKLQRYRGSTAPPDVAGRHVAIVDDGIATGATMFACVNHLRELDAARITVGIPVGPADTVEQLRSLADAVICLEQPRYFGAVGQHYRSFEQVSDETAIALLADED